MGSASRTAVSFAWSFLEQSGSKAILMLIQVILARILSPEAFGILAILLVVTQISDSIAQSGLGMALVQRRDTNGSSYSTAWWLSLGLAVIVYTLIFFGSKVIGAFYSMPELVTYLRVLGLAVFFNSANSIQRAFLQRKLDFKSIFIATTFAAFFSGIGGIVLALLGCGVWSLVIQALLQSIFVFLIMWARVSWKPAFVFDRSEANSLFGYGWKICVTGILNVLYSGISELVIGRACSSRELGLYSQGRKYPQAGIGVMSSAIANVLFPVFSAIKDNSVGLHNAIYRGLRLGTFIVAPISFLTAVVAQPLVAILLTEKWLACVPIFQLACISNAALMLQLVNLRAYMALGNSGLYMRLQVIKVIGGGAIIWITALITRDIYMTAWSNFFVGVLSIFFVDLPPAKRVHGYPALQQVKALLPIFALSTVASVVAVPVQFFRLNYVFELSSQCVIFFTVYLFGAKVLRFQELFEVVAMAKKLVSRAG